MGADLMAPAGDQGYLQQGGAAISSLMEHIPS